MRRSELAEYIGARPFQPFRIHVSDGATFEIRHPEFAWLLPHSLMIATPEELGPAHLIERNERVDLLHITRIEMVPTEPNTNTDETNNGVSPDNN